MLTFCKTLVYPTGTLILIQFSNVLLISCLTYNNSCVHFSLYNFITHGFMYSPPQSSYWTLPSSQGSFRELPYHNCSTSLLLPPLLPKADTNVFSISKISTSRLIVVFGYYKYRLYFWPCVLLMNSWPLKRVNKYKYLNSLSVNGYFQFRSNTV